jgi:hypothetical protein
MFIYLTSVRQIKKPAAQSASRHRYSTFDVERGMFDVQPFHFSDPTKADGFSPSVRSTLSFYLEALERLAQAGEPFDFAQDRELVERLVEPFVI